MKSKLLKVAGAALASALLALPAAGQSSGGTSGGTGSTGSAGTDTQTYSQPVQADNKRDWGWIGLLGLIGLAGMRRKHDDDGYRGKVTGRPA